MGMYTELIFGAQLKEETPQEVVEALRYMIGDLDDKPERYPFTDPKFEWFLRCRSYYFGVNKAIGKIWFDTISKAWHISTRSNSKNYSSEIEAFLAWILPWIEQGSGDRDMSAIVIDEGFTTPIIYYLEENDA